MCSVKKYVRAYYLRQKQVYAWLRDVEVVNCLEVAVSLQVLLHSFWKLPPSSDFANSNYLLKSEVENSAPIISRFNLLKPSGNFTYDQV
jgi:uncharacterized protein YfaQ (DUF2300 family)